MGERVQPGGRVDEQVYERFRDFVEQHHGQVRGALGEELERAMEDRMDAVSGDQVDQLTRIEDDIATLKAAVAEQTGDGGACVSDAMADTPAPADRADSDTDGDLSKPAPNQPRADKARWLAQQVRQRADCQGFTEPAIGVMVDEEYGFEGDARDALVELTIDELGAEPDPTDPDDIRIAWGDELQDRQAQHRRQQAADADEQFDRMAGATADEAADSES